METCQCCCSGDAVNRPDAISVTREQHQSTKKWTSLTQTENVSAIIIEIKGIVIKHTKIAKKMKKKLR